MPSRRTRVMEVLEAAVRDHAAGRASSWAHGLGPTVLDASRALGALWNDRTPLPDDVRWHAAATFRCDSRDVATYGALAQRMLRQLPRHLPPGTSGDDAPPSDRERPAAVRPAAGTSHDELAVRATIVDAARWIARDRRMPWATFFGESAGEAVARVGVLWRSEATVPEDVRAAMAHVLECPASAVDTYGRLARRIAAALPRAFERARALEERAAGAGYVHAGVAREEPDAPELSMSRRAAGPPPPADTMTTRRPPQPPNRSKSGVRSRSSIGHLRVLVVEANADLALLLGEHLSAGGHRPAIVFTIEQARAMLDASPFDLVLIESSGSGPIDGVGLARRLRAAGRTEVVVVMTDFRSPELEEEALAAGAGACLGKPFGREELFAAIQKGVLRAARLGSPPLR